MYFQPFSPRWLIEQGREQEARDVLRRARMSDEEAEQELGEIKHAAKEAGGLREVWRPQVRPLVAVGLALAVAQQLIGVNTVIYYAPTILKFTGLSTNSAITQALSVGITNVIFTIVAIILLDRVGRRLLLVIGTGGCILSLALLGVFFASNGLQHSASWVALVCLIVYIASFAVGLGPVFWLMISEIFPLTVRSPAMSLSTVGNWTANFLVSSFFLTLVDAISREGTFWLYAGFGVLALIFFLARVPETKGRSLEEIAHDLGADEQPHAHTVPPTETMRLRSHARRDRTVAAGRGLEPSRGSRRSLVRLSRPLVAADSRETWVPCRRTRPCGFGRARRH